MTKAKFQFSKIKLNTFAIILSIIALVTIMTWIVPSGKYQTMEVNGRAMVIAGSYERVPASPQGIFDVLTAPIKGFTSAADIIVFLLIIGGVFAVIEKTGAITAGIKKASLFFASSPSLKKFFIPLSMLVFSIGGATFGMAEETLIFIPIFIALSLSLGYDSTVGVCIPFLGAAAGFGSAFANPFTLGIAQGIADLPLYSGLGYRLIVWVICTIVVTAFVVIYANRIYKDPKKSLTYDFDKQKRKELESFDQDKDGHIRTSEILVLATFILGMILLVAGVLKPQLNEFSVKHFSFDFINAWGLSADGWYIVEIAALFLGIAFVCAVLGKLSMKDASQSFFDGVRSMAEIALLLAFAKAIVIVANNGFILDTILDFMAKGISKLHPVFASWAAFLVQAVVNFFIPSGSSKAVLTMPIMTPLADLIGITRQTMVLAYQFGDGWTNLCIPTSPITIAAIGFANIPFAKWFKWILPLMIILFVMSMLLLIPPVIMNWQ